MMKATRWIAGWASALIGLAMTAFAQSPPAPTGGYKMEETLLGSLDPLDAEPSSVSLAVMVIIWLTSSTAIRSYASSWTAKWAQIDGIAKSCPCFYSPDGRHVAYGARNGDYWCVVIDGEAVGQYDTVGTSPPIFSPDSKHIAYPAKLDQKWAVVMDGQVERQDVAILGGSVKFSPDSRRLAYATFDGKGWTVVVDGQAGAEFDGIVGGDPIFSPDSRHIAYVAKKGEKWQVVIDGHAGTEYDGIEGD